MLTPRSLTLLGAVLLLFGCARPALACACAGPDARGQFSRAHSVFIGRLVEERLVSPEAVELVFEVDRYWKGGREPVRRLRSGFGSSCDLPFFVGEDYLVYGDLWDGEGMERTGGVCHRTAPLHLAREDLALLGRGWRPEPDRTSWHPRILVLTAVFLGALLIALHGLRARWSRD